MRRGLAFLGAVASILLGTLFFIASLVYGAGQNYLNPVGHVNDFASIIDPVTERNLESQLRDYRDKTSIEIAVATVVSLDGTTVDDYAQGLFNKWGIGDSDKDNGVLILVAPSEREMKIEVGYGMEPDLTDAQAGRIIQNVMIPHFREQQMTVGIVAGVNAVLSELGGTPFEVRLEERRIAEEKRQAEAKRQAENMAVFLRIVGIIVGLVVIIGTPLVLIYRKIRIRKRLRGQFDENIKGLDKCRVLIIEANNKHPEAQKNLDELKKEVTIQIWSGYSEILQNFAGTIRSVEAKLHELTNSNQLNGWKKSEETWAGISSLEARIFGLVILSASIKKVTEEVRRLRENSPSYLTKTLGEIKTIRPTLDHKDVSEVARQLLSSAEKNVDEAQASMSSLGIADWIAIYDLIESAADLAQQSVRRAKADKENAEEARRPKPVYRSSSSSHRSPGSGRGFGGSRSGGGFGGFGGGRSGGGGARGKW